MRLYMLAIISSIAIVPQFVGATEPLPPKRSRPVPSPAHFQSAVSHEQLEHLKAAAEHLAKAGRKDEAAKLLEQAAVIESGQAAALLAKKEKELFQLQAEVEQRKLVRRQPHISVAFQVLQLSRERLKQQDIPNIELLLPNDAEKFQFHVFVNPNEVVKLIDDLRKRDLVKVLAEPTIVTVSGRPAHFHSGGEVPVLKRGIEPETAIEYARFGTEVDVVPIVVGDKVRLEIRLRVAEIDPARSVTVGHATIPSLRTHLVDTAAEMRLGEALVLGGMMEKRRESQVDANGKTHEITNEIETIVLVTPKRVDGTEPVAHPAVRASYMPATKAAVVPKPLNFGGVTPHVINQEDEEEPRLINQ